MSDFYSPDYHSAKAKLEGIARQRKPLPTLSADEALSILDVLTSFEMIRQPSYEEQRSQAIGRWGCGHCDKRFATRSAVVQHKKDTPDCRNALILFSGRDRLREDV